MKTNRYLSYSLILFLTVCITSCSGDGDTPPPASSAYISKVYEFNPAPGQFTNVLPKYVAGDTPQTMIEKAEAAIKGDKGAEGKKINEMISLGGFGGYVVFGFDHMIQNLDGYRDFRVLGNAFWKNSNPSARGGSCEPGIIMVSHDANGNGNPDDTWYEIAGSEYTNSIKNYSITYYKPLPDASDEEYIRWTDNHGGSGYRTKNQYHSQSYWPEWVTADEITFTGTTRLPDNGVDESGNGTLWVLDSYAYGYADNAPNNDDESAIDIDWAVDASGNHVKLPGIHFVKVYSGVNQECGWIGETSTEITGACDLHMLGVSIKTR